MNGSRLPSSKLVRWALCLYPRKFRDIYADEMMEVYDELCLKTPRRACSRAILAARTILNLLKCSFLERMPGPAVGPPRHSNSRSQQEDGSTLMDSIWQDIRFAFRMLRRSPLFTAVSIFTLAVGIGATTASFHLIQSYFLSPTLRGPGGELVRVYTATPTGSAFSPFSFPAFEDLRERAQVFSQVAAHRRVSSTINMGGTEEPVSVELVTGDYFSLFGVGAERGRLLWPEDNVSQGAHPVLVISHSFWRAALGRDLDVVGRTLDLSGTSFTIVGVAPARFPGSHSGFATDLWVPVMMHNQARPTGSDLRSRGWGWLTATASVKPETTMHQVQADLDRIGAQLNRDYPGHFENRSFVAYPASPLPDELREGVWLIVMALTAVVVLVLLVGCANIASVLMGRVVARRREIAVRMSLGSGRLRLMRLWVCEALTLSFSGGLLGLVVAVAMHSSLLSMISDPNLMPGVSQDFNWGGVVLGFTLVASVLTGCLFGLVPSLQAGRVNVAAALKDAVGSATASARGSRLRAAFVVTQVTVSVVLLVGAGLLLRTLGEADAFDPGFETANLLLAPVNLGAIGYDPSQSQRFAMQLMERLSAHDDVRNASYAMSVPLSGGRDSSGFVIPGHEPSPEKPWVIISTNVVGPDYFATIGIPIVRGRGFGGRIAAAGMGEVVINETMAARYWSGEDPLGQQFRSADANPRTLQVVGVARDIKYYSLGEPPRPFVYARADQAPAPFFTIHVRTENDAVAFLPALKAEVAALEGSLQVRGAMTFEQLRRVPLLPQKMMAQLTVVFSSMALLLTAVGIYGVVAQSVAGRVQEIGVRMALGGGRGDIVRMILTRVCLLVGVGLILGLTGAAWAFQLIEGFLFGISATDPLTYAMVALLLIVVALAASLNPLRRATGVDPVTALRYQ